MKFGYGKSAQNVHGYKNTKGPKTFWMAPGTETEIVLLDDLPAEICRHQLYIKGDKTAAKMRQTCAGSDPDEFQNPVPRQCVVCNAMLRNKVIGRKGYLYLSMIEVRAYVWKGKNYKDMKMLLELDPKSGDIWQRKRDAHGGLAGARFKVYRSQKQNSSRVGDDWQFVEKVDLVRNFWYSPGVKFIIEAKQKAGERIEHPEAVKLFTARYQYETMIDNYDADSALAFTEYAGGGAQGVQGQGQPQGQTSYGGNYDGSGNIPPPPPADGQNPDYSTGQQQSVPASQAPTIPPAAPPAPAQTQASAPPQGQQTPPPPPPDPSQGQQQQAAPEAPAEGYQAPPLPPAAAPAAAPAPAPAPAPAAAPPASGAPVGGGYEFDQSSGWSGDPPF